jgi:hypothetical protein
MSDGPSGRHFPIPTAIRAGRIEFWNGFKQRRTSTSAANIKIRENTPWHTGKSEVSAVGIRPTSNPTLSVQISRRSPRNGFPSFQSFLGNSVTFTPLRCFPGRGPQPRQNKTSYEYSSPPVRLGAAGVGRYFVRRGGLSFFASRELRAPIPAALCCARAAPNAAGA